VLSNEAEGLFALGYPPDNDLARFGPAVLLSHRLPTISFNIAAFDEFAQRDQEIEQTLESLDAELEHLALVEEDEEPVSEDDSDSASGESFDVD
jgi:hypothetical protein